MALLERQVYNAPYLLTSFRPSFTTNRQNKSILQYVNGGSSLIMSFDKSANFLLLKLSSQLLAPDTLSYDGSDQRITPCHPSTPMGYLFMTRANYQFSNPTGLWQQYWMLDLNCQCRSWNSSPNSEYSLPVHEWI